MRQSTTLFDIWIQSLAGVGLQHILTSPGVDQETQVNLDEEVQDEQKPLRATQLIVLSSAVLCSFVLSLWLNDRKPNTEEEEE